MIRSPLQIPELRAYISLFLPIKDAIACAQVCKEWSKDFTYPIWHTIDFDRHKKLSELDPEVLEKYGHKIRIIEGVWSYEQVETVFLAKATTLKRLCMLVGANTHCRERCCDIIQRSLARLQHIELFGLFGYLRDNEELWSVDALSGVTSTLKSSRLSYIRLHGMKTSRDTFLTLLRQCPALNRLYIQDVTLHPGDDNFQHTSLKCLGAPVAQVFRPDSNSPCSPSLLVHFPNILTWQTWESPDPLVVSMEVIKNELHRCCPRLNTLYLEMPGHLMAALITNVPTTLREVAIDYNFITVEVIQAILRHQETLECIDIIDPKIGFYESEDIPVLEDYFQEPGSVIQMMPQHCAQLKQFKFSLHRMDIEDIEKTKWGCGNLEDLYLRIDGLDTQETIDQAVQLWIDAKHRIRSTGPASPSSDSLQEDSSLAARVARHLLKFPKLRSVWLGNGVKTA
ncbi:hypothetical protein EDD21DRAFT_361694 [Dissophora ornata]|nr:hypothetical protein BGZ58_008402 [Dissophora ornata]KAI8606171.1 hypothetical protein EDD21DRAFT_361694 [Dissophora ornata]